MRCFICMDEGGHACHRCSFMSCQSCLERWCIQQCKSTCPQCSVAIDKGRMSAGAWQCLDDGQRWRTQLAWMDETQGIMAQVQESLHIRSSISSLREELHLGRERRRIILQDMQCKKAQMNTLSRSLVHLQVRQQARVTVQEPRMPLPSALHGIDTADPVFWVHFELVHMIWNIVASCAAQSDPHANRDLRIMYLSGKISKTRVIHRVKLRANRQARRQHIVDAAAAFMHQSATVFSQCARNPESLYMRDLHSIFQDYAPAFGASLFKRVSSHVTYLRDKYDDARYSAVPQGEVVDGDKHGHNDCNNSGP